MKVLTRSFILDFSMFNINKYYVNFFLGLLTSLLLFEVILHVTEATPLWKVFPVIRPILGMPDRDIGYTLTPNATGIWTKENRSKIIINNFGMRDAYLPKEKPMHQIRVGLTGDSVSEAFQVDQAETFDNLTENLFHANNYDVKLLNFAMSGNGPLRQLVKLNKDGFQHKLDLVVSITSISDFNTNELLDDSLFPAYKISNNDSLVIGYGFRNRRSVKYIDTFIGKSFMWAYQNSRVFNAVYTRAKAITMPEIFAVDKGTYENTLEQNECSTDSLDTYLDLWKNHTPKNNWLAKNKFFDDYSSSLKRNNVKGIYLLSGISVSDGNCKAFYSKRGELIDIIQDELSGYNIEFIDMQRILHENLPKGITIEKLNGFGKNIGAGHLNQLGHTIYARTLFKIIEPHIIEMRKNNK